MTSPARALLFAFALAALVAGGLVPGLVGVASAQPAPYYEDASDTRAALTLALGQQRAAEQRGLRLEHEAAQASEAAGKSARQAAALAARIQQAEAGLGVAEGRLQLIHHMRTQLRARLALRQRPVVHLTAALQNISRRPLALALLRPGSVREIVYLRAVLASTLPQVAARTAMLRTEIARLQALQREAHRAVGTLRRAQVELEDRRVKLAALETRQRLASRAKGGIAAREADRALALAEEARDLGTLIGTLDAVGTLRQQLAMLPGPLVRPPRPDQSEVVAESTGASAGASAGASGFGSAGDIAPPSQFQLPVAGRTIAGFGAQAGDGTRSQGLTIAPRARAQVVAPAAGRVAFAGPYRGYGRIVIIEHPGGWTSLVTGLVRVDVGIGQQLVGGAPLGIAAIDRPAIMVELRRDGVPVNPVDYVR